MGNEQDKVITGDLSEKVHDHNCISLVKVAGRLVGKDNGWILYYCTGDGNSLLLTARKGVGCTSSVLLHTNVFKGDVHPAPYLILVTHTA